MMPMAETMTLPNGTQVMADGTCVMKDGKKMMLKEGQEIGIGAAETTLPAMALRWNICNLVRGALLGGCLSYAYRANSLQSVAPR